MAGAPPTNTAGGAIGRGAGEAWSCDGAGWGRGVPGTPAVGETSGWRGPERIWPGRGGDTGCAGRFTVTGSDGTFGATGSAGFAAGAIGGEMRPPAASGGRRGATAFGFAAAAGSAPSAAGSAAFNGTANGPDGRTGCAGAVGTAAVALGTVTAGAATGGRIAADDRCTVTTGGGGATGGAECASAGSSSMSPPLRSACGSSSIRYRVTLGSSFRWFRMRRARSSSIELEWVFLS